MKSKLDHFKTKQVRIVDSYLMDACDSFSEYEWICRCLYATFSINKCHSLEPLSVWITFSFVWICFSNYVYCSDGLSERSAGSSCTQDPADQCVANASCANNETCTCDNGFYQDGGVCAASKCEWNFRTCFSLCLASFPLLDHNVGEK